MIKIYSLIVLFIILGTMLVSFEVKASNPEIMSEAEPTLKFALWALILGGLSAISLPLGSLLGLVWKPNPKVTASFTAFGAGALLAALSIELIAPTVMEAIGETAGISLEPHTNAYSVKLIISLIAGCIAGGIFFYLLNEALNMNGGYLRKVSTTISYLNHIRHHKIKFIIENLKNSPLLINIPKDQVQSLVRNLRPVSFHKDEVIAKEGEKGNRMFIVESGEVYSLKNGQVVKKEGKGDLIAETSLFLNIPYLASLVAASDIKAYELLKEDFDKIRRSSPEFNKIVKDMAIEEYNYLNLTDTKNKEFEVKSDDWEKDALKEIHHSSEIPTDQEVQVAAKSHDSAPMSIWLGILLDGIPESFVIGAGFLMLLGRKMALGDPSFSDVIPYTLIAGLFLSNFPEAMSSSIGMKNIGWKTFKIMMMWVSLMLITALGAVFGYYFGAQIPELFAIAVEGLAAGAMLTMIAQTMIPEAVHIGGHHVVGLSTLAGYLGAVAFKLLE
jgi:CRP-like cAMP-binding protein